MGLTKHKKLSKSRSVTIPKDLAANTGLFSGSAIDLMETDNGILIRKHVPTCICCGSVESVDTVKGKEICAKCAGEIREEICEKYA